MILYQVVRYFIYISDAKLDMLLPQIPHELKTKKALELKIDLKLLSATRRTEVETEASRVARLETVTEFLEEFGRLGTVDEPDDYIQDTVSMRWGPYWPWPSPQTSVQPKSSPLIYFGGSTPRTVVGLAGSAKHVLGASFSSSTYEVGTPMSAMPYLMEFLLRTTVSDSESDQFNLDRADDAMLSTVIRATERMKGPSQQLEFLAKRLMHGSVDGEKARRQVVLGTPLYVAMAD